LQTGKSADAARTKIDKYYDYKTGFGMGGAIKKNKLFYYTSIEIGRKSEPVLFAPGTSAAVITQAVAKSIAYTLAKRYGYNSGSYGDINTATNSNKFFGRLDWNISKIHKLQIRNNYVNAFSDYLERGANSLNFESHGYRQLSKTNSTVLELKSNFSNKISNNLVIGYTTVNDKRDIAGAFFPHIEITYNTANVIFAGAYREAAVYGLKLKTFEATYNVVFYKNKHTITLGTHNEIYDVDYWFLTAYNGRWAYSSPASFFADKPSRIRGVYNTTNNDYEFNKNKPSAKFRVLLLGSYLQDEWAITKHFNITAGIRFDFTVQPNQESPNLKVTALKQFNEYQNKLSNAPQLAPSLGFN
jgi:outer membrane receptor for ferrienterochelin and colicin